VQDLSEKTPCYEALTRTVVLGNEEETAVQKIQSVRDGKEAQGLTSRSLLRPCLDGPAKVVP
jgi:hypothetical protein